MPQVVIQILRCSKSMQALLALWNHLWSLRLPRILWRFHIKYSDERFLFPGTAKLDMLVPIIFGGFENITI